MEVLLSFYGTQEAMAHAIVTCYSFDMVAVLLVGEGVRALGQMITKSMFPCVDWFGSLKPFPDVPS